MVLGQGNCWIRPDCSSAHLNVLVHAPSRCPTLAHLLDLMDQTVEISTVHVPPSLLHVFNHISEFSRGSKEIGHDSLQFPSLLEGQKQT